MDKLNEKMRDVAAVVGEHFTDFVLIVRQRDGLLWRMSDRTFALGACKRLITRLDSEDVMSIQNKEEL